LNYLLKPDDETIADIAYSHTIAQADARFVVLEKIFSYMKNLQLKPNMLISICQSI